MVSEPKAHISKVKRRIISTETLINMTVDFLKVKAQKRQKEKGDPGSAVLSYYMAAGTLEA